MTSDDKKRSLREGGLMRDKLLVNIIMMLFFIGAIFMSAIIFWYDV